MEGITMQKHLLLWLALLMPGVFALVLGCNDSTEATPTTTSGTTGTATDAAFNGVLSGSGAPAASGAGRGGNGASNAGGAVAQTGTNKGSQAGAGGASAASGKGGKAPAVSGAGGAATAADGGASGASSTANGGAPAPVDTPYVWGLGVGITDLPAATKFYKEVMKMTVEKEVTRADRKEVVLYASEAKRGSRLVLMNFNDKRNTEKITAKLVWQASDTAGVNRDASNYPGYVSRLNMGIVQFDGPETYIHEVGNIFDTAGAGITVPYLIALGFSTSDQPASRKFYTDAFGMTESYTGGFAVTDATGTGNITEYTEKLTAGAGLVLQSWVPARNSKDNPVKIVIFVPDAQAVADKVVAAGGSIAEKAARTEVYDNRLLIVAKDPDGYILEIVQ
jgi:predicted enzyme related to lactoylglutathione lyase